MAKHLNRMTISSWPEPTSGIGSGDCKRGHRMTSPKKAYDFGISLVFAFAAWVQFDIYVVWQKALPHEMAAAAENTKGHQKECI